MADIITHYKLYDRVKDLTVIDDKKQGNLNGYFSNPTDFRLGCGLNDMYSMSGVLDESITHSKEKVDELKLKVLRHKNMDDLIPLVHGMENHNIVDDIMHYENEFFEYLRSEISDKLSEIKRFRNKAIPGVSDIMAEAILGGYLRQKNPEIIEQIKKDKETFLDYGAELTAELASIWDGGYSNHKKTKIAKLLRKAVGSIDPDDFGTIKGVAKTYGNVFHVRSIRKVSTWKDWGKFKIIFGSEEKVARLDEIEKEMINRIDNENGGIDKKLGEIFIEMENSMKEKYNIKPTNQETLTLDSISESLSAQA